MDAEGWEAVKTLSERHGLTGLVARGLEWAHEGLGFEAPVLARLAAARQGQLVQLLVYRRAARRVAEALEASGIPFIIYKGAVLAEEAYGDLSLRAFRDCDILVRKCQLKPAFDVLQALGYQLAYEQSIEPLIAGHVNAAALSHSNGSAVDLHWSIAGGELLPSDPELVWQRSYRSDKRGALPGLRMSPEMTLVNLATHFHRHSYEELKPLVDFYVAAVRWAGQIDPDELVRIAEPLGMLPMVDLAARLCERLFIPSPTIRRLAVGAPSLRARMALQMLTPASLLRLDKVRPTEVRLRRLICGGTVAASARAFRRMLIPKPRELEQRFGRPIAVAMYPRYYLVQVYRVVTRSRKPFDDLI